VHLYVIHAVESYMSYNSYYNVKVYEIMKIVEDFYSVLDGGRQVQVPKLHTLKILLK
jgi:hypothetical protein